MKLAINLTKILKQKGVSLSRLAKDSGVPVSTLHGWQNGRETLNMQQLKKVASCLEVSIHYLAFGENDPYESVSEEVLKEIFSGDVRVSLHRITRKK